MSAPATAVTELRHVPSGAERTAETRVLSSDEGNAVTPRLAVGAPRDAMQRDEIGRLRSFALMILALSVFGELMALQLHGDALATQLFLAANAVVMLSYAFLAWLTAVPERVNAKAIAIVAQLQGLASPAALYYFGVFSPYPAVVAVGIYVYAQGSNLHHPMAIYLNLAIGQAVMGGLVIGGVIADRGLVVPAGLGLQEQIALQLCVQLVFAISLLLGRMARSRTKGTVYELEQAMRAVAQREALLAEARLAFAGAAGIGGPGRFTDQVIGSFRLGAVIGRGGVGEIYAATHVETREAAAVKLLLYSDLADADEVERFVRETRIAASLSAPNVVRVLEVSDVGAPVPYLAMERLEGSDLAATLRERGSLRTGEVVRLVGQVSRGLQTAHAAGIVHRDLKPQNLFLARQNDRRVWKILDFGVSKLTDDPSHLTQGLVLGTPAYMAPEQADGCEVDHRADVYSLAVIAYRCLTGQPAFSGQQVPEVLYAVVHKMPVRPSALAALPLEVDLVLAIALAKDPRDRFGSAGELSQAFARATRGQMSESLRARARALLAERPWRSVG